MLSPLALITASRNVQSPDPSTAAVLRQVTPVPLGAMSSKRLGKNVGSGIGIMAEGAIWPLCNEITPGRPSTLTRIGIAATGDVAVYGRLKRTACGNSPGGKVLSSIEWKACVMTFICPVLESSTVKSSAPSFVMWVRMRTGDTPELPDEATAGKLSITFQVSGL